MTTLEERVGSYDQFATKADLEELRWRPIHRHASVRNSDDEVGSRHDDGHGSRHDYRYGRSAALIHITHRLAPSPRPRPTQIKYPSATTSANRLGIAHAPSRNPPLPPLRAPLAGRSKPTLCYHSHTHTYTLPNKEDGNAKHNKGEVHRRLTNAT